MVEAAVLLVPAEKVAAESGTHATVVAVPFVLSVVQLALVALQVPVELVLALAKEAVPFTSQYSPPAALLTVCANAWDPMPANAVAALTAANAMRALR